MTYFGPYSPLTVPPPLTASWWKTTWSIPEAEPEADLTPEVGDIVLYLPAVLDLDYLTSRPRLAALITHVWTPDMVNLAVFDSDGSVFGGRSSVPRSGYASTDENGAATWCWHSDVDTPPDVPKHPDDDDARQHAADIRTLMGRIIGSGPHKATTAETEAAFRRLYDELPPLPVGPVADEPPTTRLYGGDRTIHDTEHLHVEVHKGEVVAVWFRCQMLPFEQVGVDKHRAVDMKDGGYVLPALVAVEVRDA